jgi:hypothetical protein
VNLLALWIWVSVAASLAGWVLSALDQLNRGGYVVFAVLAAGILFFGRKALGISGSRPVTGTFPSALKLRRRFSRPLPFCFLVLTVLIFIGGALYAPSNHTGLSYRTPRVLHWLAEGHWVWIHTTNYRMNDRACGFEWLTAPLFLFLRSDRPIFLLNFVPYLFLPGLLFSICRTLRVYGRVAWQWMWIFPTGYSFLLQAGSAGNDTFPTVYALAGIHFALRAWKSGRVSDLWLSGLSGALLTGAKASNLPLLLPWAIALLPALPLLRRKPLWTFVIVTIALVVSFLPTAILNFLTLRDWSGLNIENAGMNMKNPVVGIWGNIFIFLLDNFLPPFFPMAGWWNQHALAILPQWMMRPMQANFESGFHIVGELPTEDWVGIGFGVSVLAAASVIAAIANRNKSAADASLREPDQFRRMLIRLLLIAPWVSLLAYCMKSGMVTGPRLISPYYPLLLPALLVLRGQTLVVRQRWWNALVWLMLLLAFPVLIMTPGRPLWPAKTVLGKLHVSHPNSAAIDRALKVYETYAIRPDPLANVRALLPPGLKVVGFMASEDDIEVSLWRPFGQTVVKDVLVTDTAEQLRARGLEYIVVGGLHLKLRKKTLEQWLRDTGAEIVASTTATIKLGEGEQSWYLARVKN